jgi:hypothetical protein
MTRPLGISLILGVEALCIFAYGVFLFKNTIVPAGKDITYKVKIDLNVPASIKGQLRNAIFRHPDPERSEGEGSYQRRDSSAFGLRKTAQIDFRDSPMSIELWRYLRRGLNYLEASGRDYPTAGLK